MKYGDFLQFMAKLKAQGLEASIPNVTLLNAQFLHFLVLTKHATSILEIGTANGYSTLFLAEAAKRNGGYVTSLEINTDSHNQARGNATACGLDDVIDFIESDAETFVPFMDKVFDFVFIDARKRSYLNYFEAVKPKLAPQATVVFDDVIKFKDKMADLFGYMEREHPHNHFILPVDGDDGVMIYIHDADMNA